MTITGARMTWLFSLAIGILMAGPARSVSPDIPSLPAHNSTECGTSQLGCTWERTLGGKVEDKIYGITELTNGDYAIAGYTRSTDGLDYDGWLVRLDRSGQVIWQHRFGGYENDQLYGLAAMPDGGLVAAGFTRSRSAGESDVWVIRVSGEGSLVWEANFGGVENDRARSIQVTSDGNILVAGTNASKGLGNQDAWILLLDSKGKLIWDRSFGGPGSDGVLSTAALTDGSVAFAGYREAPNGFDYWVVKLDAQGQLKWNRPFLFGGFSAATAITAAPDGGIYVAGLAQLALTHPPEAVLLRLDARGAQRWRLDLGGKSRHPGKGDEAWSIATNKNGGCIVAIATASRGAGSTDARLVSISESGDVSWERLFGRTKWDRPSTVAFSADGGMLVGGHTTSMGAGYEDGWVLRLDKDGRIGSK